MNPAPNFLRQLEDYVADYRGPREISIRHAAALYRFYETLYVDASVPREARTVINAVLTYFVVSDDVIPEEVHGQLGLVDDVFLAAHGYRLLCRLVDVSVLSGAWHAPDDLDHDMARIYKDSRAAVGKKRKDILRMAGLANSNG